MCDLTYTELIDSAASYESKCDWTSAIAVYQQLYAQTPTLLVISKLAWCYSRNSNFKEAKAECAKLVEKEPQNPKWWYMYGYQFYMEKNWDEAIKHFEKALECNPEYFVVLYRISYAYLQLAGEYLKLTKSEYWKAIGYLEKAHQVWKLLSVERKEVERSTYYHVNFLHGKALMLIPNHNDKAIRLFKQALILKDDADCRYNLAKALFYDEQYEQAKQVLPKEQKYYVVELAANIEYKMGNTDEALNIVLGLLQKRTKDYLFCFVANIKSELGNYIEAYQYAQKAVSANNKNHKNHYMLALVYFKLGLLKKALEALGQAECLKKKKYNNVYQDCEDLRNQINKIMDADYVEDSKLIASLEKPYSYYMASVVKYNDKRGFGFVYIDGQRVFVHVSNVRNGKLYNGAKIQFKIESTNKGKQAIDIKIIT